MWRLPVHRSFRDRLTGHVIGTLTTRIPALLSHDLYLGSCVNTTKRTYWWSNGRRRQYNGIIPTQKNPAKIVPVVPHIDPEYVGLYLDIQLDPGTFDKLISIYREENRLTFLRYPIPLWCVDLLHYDDFCMEDVPNLRKKLKKLNIILERFPRCEGQGGCEITKQIESIGRIVNDDDGDDDETPVAVVKSGKAFFIANLAGSSVDNLIENQVTGVTEYLVSGDANNIEEHQELISNVGTYRTYDIWLIAEFIELMRDKHKDIPVRLCEKTKSAMDSRFDELQMLQRPIPELVDTHKVDLFPHQNEGIRFLQQAQGRAILAMEMGLGKTVTTLAYIAQERKRALVICPKHVRSHWVEDATKFFPGYFGDDETVILGAFKGNAKAIKETKQKLTHAKLVCVNHESLQPVLPLILGSENKFDCLVLDESHLLKNREAQRTQRILKCKDHFQSRIMLSGTPIKNEVSELESQLEILGHKVEDLDLKSPGAVWNFLHGQNIYLQKAITQVFPHLAFQEPTIVGVPLGDDDVDYFDKHWSPDDLLVQVQKKLIEIAMAKTGETCKFALGELSETPDDKIIIFTERRKPLSEIYSILENLQPGVALMHHGGMKDGDRLNVIEAFRQSGPESPFRILVSTRQSLAVGVNLQCANKVIFNDMAWSPADIRQASGRVRRLNQTKRVQEFWMEAEADFDRILMAKLRDKLTLIMQYAEGKNLTEEELAWMNKQVTIYDISGLTKPEPKRKKKRNQGKQPKR